MSHKPFHPLPVALALGIALSIPALMPASPAEAKSLYKAKSAVVPASAKPGKPYRAAAQYSRDFQPADPALQTGRYAAAEAGYAAKLAKTPNNITLRGAMALAQAEQYKLDPAEKNAKIVLAKDPNNAMAHAVLGIIARNRTASLDMTYRGNRENLLSQSAAELERANQLNAHSPEIHNQLGQTYRYQGRMADANAQFDKALSLDPSFAEALVNKGVVQLQQGNTNGAKSTYRQAIKLNSHNDIAHYRLGEALLQGGDPHAALQELNTALALNKGNPSILAKMGEAYEAQGNTAGAVASYQKSILASPTYMPAYTRLANVLDQRGDGEMAMVELKSALNVNPKYSPARNQLGHLALTVDKPDQAAQYYKEALQENPNDAAAADGLSQALMMTAQRSASTSQFTGSDSDLVSAEQTVNEALRLNPNDLRLHLAALRISQLAGKPQESQAELQRLVANPAQNDNQRMIQGEAYLALGRYQEADNVFGGLMQSANGNPDKLLLIGDTLKSNGDLDGARTAYQQVLQTEPSNLKAQRAIARVDAAQKDAEKSTRLAKSLNNWRQKGSSIDYYEEALAKNPRQPEARLALAKLYEKYKRYGDAAQSYRFYMGLVPNMDAGDREHFTKKIQKMDQLSGETPPTKP